MRKKVLIDISVRHVHLTREDVDILFGDGYELTPRKILGEGYGGFAADERVILIGPKGTIHNVAILGPYRPTQIEIAMTDARTLGIQPPIRLSGDTVGSSPIRIVGPKGEVYLKEGVIIAKRHMHITKAVADKWGITDDSLVSVNIETPNRTVIYKDIPCRITLEGPSPVIHIDTDEANAAGMLESMYGYLVD